VDATKNKKLPPWFTPADNIKKTIISLNRSAITHETAVSPVSGFPCAASNFYSWAKKNETGGVASMSCTDADKKTAILYDICCSRLRPVRSWCGDELVPSFTFRSRWFGTKWDEKNARGWNQTWQIGRLNQSINQSINHSIN